MSTVTGSVDVLPSAVDDRTALRRYARHRDPEAFASLASRYQRMVFSTCRRALGNDADAEDASQETFLKLARSAGSIRSNTGSWLHRCAMGTAIDVRRRREARLRHESSASGVEPGEGLGQRPHRSDEVSEALWRDLEPLIDRALSELAPDDREVVVQRYLVGRPAAALASELGVTAATVHRRTERALTRLRAKLAASGLAVAGASALVGALAHAQGAAVPATLASATAKIGISGVPSMISGASSTLSSAVSDALSGGLAFAAKPALLGTLAAGVLVAAGVGFAVIGAGSVGGSRSGSMTMSSFEAMVEPRSVPRPDNAITGMQFTGAIYPTFAEGGAVISSRELRFNLIGDRQTGRSATLRLGITGTDLDADPPIIETRTIGTDLLPGMVARLNPGDPVRIAVRWDEFDRLVLEPLTPGVQLGRNEPNWFGVRPPKGWSANDEIPRDAGPLGILGPWAANERWPVTLAPHEIRVGGRNWTAARYRIVEWDEQPGEKWTRIVADYTEGYNQDVIGRRFRMLLRARGEGYELALFPTGRGPSGATPSSFEHTDANPVQVLSFAPTP